MMMAMDKLEAVVGLLLDGREAEAVRLWNSLHLEPPLKKAALSEDGESLELVTEKGEPLTLPLDNALNELAQLES